MKHYLSCAAGLTVVVLQSGDQVSHPGVTVMMECSMGPGLSMGSYTMYWYRQNHYGAPLEFLTKEYDQTVGHFQSSIDTSKNYFSLQITELFLNDSSTYYCAASHSDENRPDSHTNNNEAYFGAGTKLTVLERNITQPTVTVFRPSLHECENKNKNGTDVIRRKTLLCVASGFYPDHVSVSWKVDGKKVDKNVSTDSAAQLDGDFYRITSRLRVPAKDWHNPKKHFQCIVSFFNGNETKHFEGSIKGEADPVKRAKYLKITQSAKLSYSVFIVKSCIYGAFVVFLVWRLQGSTGKD
ncbi:uncharacterized protein AKAME5_000180400 [Lates japonicus]|uniref:Ig-like domain-containing protein n=1 Tax=Lates japonicus TaxID=270547 RepID=A0AAD3M590_LATJO|nr:uncharacterized protein AKAME5_000180400 [Lates japonicus]